MYQLFKRTFQEIDAAGRRRLVMLAIAMTVTAILDVVGVGAIIPLTALLVQSDVVATQPHFQRLMVMLNLASARDLTVVLGLATLAILVVVNLLQVWTIWLQLDTTWQQGRKLSERLLAAYLSRPYAWFLQRNTSALINTLFQEIVRVVGNVLDPVLTLASRGVAALCLIGFLVYLNPWVALAAIVLLGGAYGALYLVLRPVITRAGEQAQREREVAHQAASEALGGIKDVKLAGLQGFMLARYAAPSAALARHEAITRLMAYAPRYVLESIALGAFIIGALVLARPATGEPSAVPLLAAYAVAGYRLLPSLQQMYASMTLLRYNVGSLEGIMKDITEGEAESRTAGKRPSALAQPGDGRITLEAVSYSYPGAANPAVLQDVALEIRPKTSVALTGETGSGKTTLVDLILGLLQPTAGRILIDGELLTRANVGDWQSRIGYVPQNLYLIDDTIAANIAFGVSHGEIDMPRVIKAAIAAHLHEFVTSKLELGYDTRVGERGSRLSNGQRQRIGIARALYRNPQVLILDEATSALDYDTEEAVIDAVNSLSHELTIIMIAHRLHTIEACDEHYVVFDGGLRRSDALRKTTT